MEQIDIKFKQTSWMHHYRVHKKIHLIKQKWIKQIYPNILNATFKAYLT